MLPDGYRSGLTDGGIFVAMINAKTRVAG
jgi:hypothetical protein